MYMYMYLYIICICIANAYIIYTVTIYLLYHGAHRLYLTVVIRWNSDGIVGNGSSLFVKTQEMPKGQFMNHVGGVLVAVDMALRHFSSCIDETFENLPVSWIFQMATWWSPSSKRNSSTSSWTAFGPLFEWALACCWGLGWTGMAYNVSHKNNR